MTTDDEVVLLPIPLRDVPMVAAALRIGSHAVEEYPHPPTAGVAINGARRLGAALHGYAEALDAEARRVYERRQEQHRPKRAARRRRAA